jgi:hypothetical protein
MEQAHRHCKRASAPGDVPLAEDHAGAGHKWRLIDDQPWRRAYVVLKPGAKDSFVAKPGEQAIVESRSS